MGRRQETAARGSAVGGARLQKVAQPVAAGGAARDPRGCADGAVGEEVAGRRAMRELYTFSVAEEEDRVVADDVAASHGMHADLVLGARTGPAFAAMNV